MKAELSNLPIYFLTLFKVPIGLATRIEGLQSSFCGRERELQIATDKMEYCVN